MDTAPTRLPHSLAAASARINARTGAVFALRGDLASLEADVILLPTSARGYIASTWHPLLGVGDGQDTRISGDCLAGLRAEGAAWMCSLSENRPRGVVAVDVTGGMNPDPLEGLVAALESAIRCAERHRAELPSGRAPWRHRPLIAMPLIGTAGGGMGDSRGAVIRRILDVLHDYASKSDAVFDVAVICREPSDYAAFQTERRRIAPTIVAPWIDVVARHAQAGTLAVLFGAGVSAATGLPMWRELLDRLTTGVPDSGVSAGQLGTLDPVDAATILMKVLGPDFHTLLTNELHLTRHSLTHGLLANLHPSIAITTNYDRGYEMAIEAMGDAPVAVMPWDSPAPGQPAVLKLHGDVERRQQIVLNRGDFVTMRAFRRPLTGVLQERLLVGHVLAVGTSMSDATLVAAADEVRALLRETRSEQDAAPVGTVILTAPDRARELLLADSFEVSIGGPDVLVSARDVDVVLDWLGMQASSDLSFVLDARYSDLVADSDADLIDALRELAADLPSPERRSALEAHLASVLKELGWRSIGASRMGSPDSVL